MTSGSSPFHVPVTRLAATYWIESRRPLASLVFVAPLLVVYEAGVLMFGPEAVRNGADVWLRELLKVLGFGQYFLLPILTVCLLLGWHYTTRQPWRVSRGLLSGMAAECLLLTICLWVLLQLQAILLQTATGPPPEHPAAIVSMATSFLGAGIYEELLFRLILLGVAAWAIGRLGASPATSSIVGTLLTSLLFASAHYVGPYGETFVWFTFLFRLLAGVFFSLLFLYRGFGIAAGTHAGYDILAGLSAS